MVSFRYLVNDVEAAIQFYTQALGFRLEQQFGQAMAILSQSTFSLWLAGPISSAAQAMPDGRQPAPGGWNRIVLTVEDLDAKLEMLRAQGVLFRSLLIRGPGGRQILCEDPSGNVIELFEANR